MMPDPLNVGVTGHRKLGDRRAEMMVFAECAVLLNRLKEGAEQQSRPITAYSLLAVGADTIFAKAALGLAIPLVGVIPFENYPNDFRGDRRGEFEEILSFCRSVERLPMKQKSNEAYMAGGRWLVDHVDVLTAVWNRKPAPSLGSTGDVVDYAREQRKPIYVIDPVTGTKGWDDQSPRPSDF